MHRLVFPFNQEMYDSGLVKRISRTKLIDYVKVAAEVADVEAAVLDDLVRVVSSRDVATVAVGAFRRSRVPDCYCPAMRAGYVIDEASTVHESFGLMADPLLKGFTLHFDALVWRLEGPRVMAIEIIDG